MIASCQTTDGKQLSVSENNQVIPSADKCLRAVCREKET